MGNRIFFCQCVMKKKNTPTTTTLRIHSKRTLRTVIILTLHNNNNIIIHVPDYTARLTGSSTPYVCVLCMYNITISSDTECIWVNVLVYLLHCTSR